MTADQELVERTLRGELPAFETLFRRHGDVAHRVAARVVGPDEADDVVQDAFLRAFHQLRAFRGDSSFRAWLLQITHNTALNALSRTERSPSRELNEAGEAVDPSPERTPAARLEQHERRRRLERKLREVRPAHRAVLVLRDLEGLSYDDIAEVTGAPLGSVKGRLHRARGELIDLLRRNTYDWELPR